jgi:hypothetical protein
VQSEDKVADEEMRSEADSLVPAFWVRRALVEI